MATRANNSERMKRQNRRLLLRLLRREPVSRAELARRTGLTRAAVSLIIDPLIADGVVREAGTAAGSVGRKPVTLCINPGARVAVGVNLTREGCAVGLADLSGAVRAERLLPVRSREPDDVLRAAAETAAALLRETETEPSRLLGVGVTAPGPLSAAEGVLLDPPNFERWRGVAVAERLQEQMGCRIWLDNIACALAQAERAYGAGRGRQSFLLLTVDAGIGSGVVVGGRPLRGAGGFGSELGHVSIRPDGRPCACGNTGCLEMYAAIPHILEEAQAFCTARDWRAIADGAAAGDAGCLAAVEREAGYLADGIVSAVNLLQPEAVILAGDVAYRPDALLERLSALINARIITRRRGPVLLVAAQVEDPSGVRAAANLALDGFFGEAT